MKRFALSSKCVVWALLILLFGMLVSCRQYGGPYPGSSPYSSSDETSTRQ